MNKSVLLILISGGLMLSSGSLFAAGADASSDPSSAAEFGDKIEAAKRAGEMHADEPTEAGNFAVGKQKAFMCKGCHNKVGYKTAYPKVYEVPRLGGQHAEYIVSALKQYKNKERTFATMNAMASNLTEQDMVDIAAYYSSSDH